MSETSDSEYDYSSDSDFDLDPPPDEAPRELVRVEYKPVEPTRRLARPRLQWKLSTILLHVLHEE